MAYIVMAQGAAPAEGWVDEYLALKKECHRKLEATARYRVVALYSYGPIERSKKECHHKPATKTLRP